MLLQAIANELEELGEGDYEVVDQSLRCRGEDPQFGIEFSESRREGKIYVLPCFPRASDGSVFPYGTRPDLWRIGIGIGRTAEAVAKEIQRRFLPDYRKMFRGAAENRDAYENWMAKQSANMKMFADMTGGEIRGGTVWVRVPTCDYGYVRNFMVSDTTAQVEFRSVPIDIMKKLIELWIAEVKVAEERAELASALPDPPDDDYKIVAGHR